MAIFRRVTQFAARLTGCRRRFSGLIMIQFFSVFVFFFDRASVCLCCCWGCSRDLKKKTLQLISPVNVRVESAWSFNQSRADFSYYFDEVKIAMLAEMMPSRVWSIAVECCSHPHICQLMWLHMKIFSANFTLKWFSLYAKLISILGFFFDFYI